ncbi:hypothetical protein NM688_g2901 [Phlebia brevispora]|uniref:Uncharacterized protein n=1 Tax=Phlebia brevispora TaxID=194682 RepID=A0ACC1T7H5_9APHY|nr:hypothetical protein NM688_g2901 [Phlebia brevispora]
MGAMARGAIAMILCIAMSLLLAIQLAIALRWCGILYLDFADSHIGPGVCFACPAVSAPSYRRPLRASHLTSSLYYTFSDLDPLVSSVFSCSMPGRNEALRRLPCSLLPQSFSDADNSPPDNIKCTGLERHTPGLLTVHPTKLLNSIPTLLIAPTHFFLRPPPPSTVVMA